jgi:uncharacterized protein YkwD
MKIDLLKSIRQYLSWIVIGIMAVAVVILRVSLQQQPVESTQLPVSVALQPTRTPDLTQTVDQIYAKANQTLTAIYEGSTPPATPTLSAPVSTRSTQLAGAQASPLVEEVQSQENTPNPGSTNPAGSTTPGSSFTPTPSSQSIPTETLPPPPTPTGAACSYQTNTAFETSLLVLINQLRSSSGLQPLEVDPTVREVSFRHSEDMACRDFYDHIGSDGSTFLDRLHRAKIVDFAKATELLYVGRGGENSPESAFEAWLNGPSSYEQLTHPAYNRIGIGYVYKEDSSYGGYFTIILLSVLPDGD